MATQVAENTSATKGVPQGDRTRPSFQEESGGPQKQTTVYLAGPMRGIPDYNKPAFRKAATFLRGRGYAVVNPHDLDEDSPEYDFTSCMKRDLPILIQECDEIAVLPGWRNSEGARLEAHIGHALGKPVFDATTLAAEPVESILAEADRLVHLDRERQYGHPAVHHTRTSMLWSAYLGVSMQPWDVSMMMVLDKVARQRHCPKRDNLVDIAGYANVADRVLSHFNPAPPARAPEPGTIAAGREEGGNN